MKYTCIKYFLFAFILLFAIQAKSQNESKQVTIDGLNFLKDYYSKIIQSQNVNSYDCFYLILYNEDIKKLNNRLIEDLNPKKSESDMSSILLEHKESNPLFVESKDIVWGDSLHSTVRLNVRIFCEQRYLGRIIVKFDSSTISIEMKRNKLEKEIKSEDLKRYLVDRKSGTYKLNCYEVKIDLEFCHNNKEIIQSTFDAFNPSQ